MSCTGPPLSRILQPAYGVWVASGLGYPRGCPGRLICIRRSRREDGDRLRQKVEARRGECDELAVGVDRARVAGADFEMLALGGAHFLPEAVAAFAEGLGHQQQLPD